MNILRINNRIGSLAALSLVVMSLSACSKWTEPQALDFDHGMKVPSEEYLSSLRAYKSSDHKVMIVTMDGIATEPVSQMSHPSAMPDSADIICMRNVGNLFPSIVQEMAEVRRTKGTKFICDVDYETINKEWLALEDARPDGEPAGTDEEFKAFVAEQTGRYLSYCDAYGFDGVMASYNGNRIGIGKFGQEGFMASLLTWKDNHKDNVLIFSGNAGGLDESFHEFLSGCDYLVIPMKEKYDPAQFTDAVGTAMFGLPEDVDRIILEVNVPSAAFPQKKDFDPQPVEAARWTLEQNDSYLRAGLCTDNSADDYLASGAFMTIRKAISIMNNTETSAN